MKESLGSQLSTLVKTGQVASMTPPGIFIGTFGYPKVYVGPLAIADPNGMYPSGREYGKGIGEIVRLNRNIYRASQKVEVADTESKFTISVQESSMSLSLVDMELDISRHLDPKTDIDRSLESPLRSMVELKSMKITSNPKIPGKVEYFHGDKGLKAEEAVWDLYKSGFAVNYLEGILSTGSLGTGTNRKLVPTRWAITAVDDIIYRNMKKEIVEFPIISNITVFSNSYIGNNFTIILLPYSLAFEMQEMWENNSPLLSQEGVSMDYEFMDGRKKYAGNVGGAYYAARLAVFEYLARIRKQAAVIVLRTIGPEYYTPLGVWVVRETVRNAFRRGKNEYSSVDELVRNIRTGIRNWNSLSKVLKNSFVQKSILEYV